MFLEKKDLQVRFGEEAARDRPDPDSTADSGRRRRWWPGAPAGHGLRPAPLPRAHGASREAEPRRHTAWPSGRVPSTGVLRVPSPGTAPAG